jgi:hypothetical protein
LRILGGVGFLLLVLAVAGCGGGTTGSPAAGAGVPAGPATAEVEFVALLGRHSIDMRLDSIGAQKDPQVPDLLPMSVRIMGVGDEHPRRPRCSDVAGHTGVLVPHDGRVALLLVNVSGPHRSG